MIRPYATPWIGSGLEVRRTGDKWPLAATQVHNTMEGREPIRIATFDEYVKNPTFAQAEKVENPLSLYPEVKYEGYSWGMAIDLNACNGCGACVIACQAENNISVVGKTEVIIGREMHWIRIDRYYEGDMDEPNTYHEPVLCMHCEDAPCEVVCPVAATVHSAEGLNEMVDDRACRHALLLQQLPVQGPPVQLPPLFGLGDPQPVRHAQSQCERAQPRRHGKMLLLVQRISLAKIDSEKQDRSVRDGEMTPPAEQTCPAEAIVFGNINDPKSKVSLLKAKNRNYTLLEELNTRPRTTYLAKLRNRIRKLRKRRHFSSSEITYGR